MSSIYEVFGVSSDLQLSNIFNKLDLSVNELFDIDSIINNSRTSMKKKREQILEVMSSSAIGNYEICMDAFEKAKLKTKRFIKEEQRFPKQSLNMNQIMELNNLFSLASEKFKKVNCSQQFYQMLSQKTSKNVANVFFNMLKSIPEDSNCRFDPEMIVNGQNFAQTIYPFVNELTTFLNGCKSESKKEEVNEYYDAHKLWKIDNQITQLENNIKKFEQEKNSYLDEYSKLQYALDKARLRKLKAKREEILNESIETQPDMFGGPDTYYKDGIEALDFDNVLDAMNKVAPEMDFVDDRDVKGKYSMIFQPKSSGLELNQKGLKKIKDYLSQKFGKENIAVRLAHSQYAPEIKKLYITFINQIDVQNELENEQLNESLDDTLNNFKYFITSSNNEKELNFMKDKLNILFNQSNDVKLQNTISELLSMIKSKLNKIKPTIDECCELSNLLEPFKPTVINITVNDDGCLEDIEKETATNNLKALASHINDKKDCCKENNIENMQTIMSLISSLASFFQKRLCENKINPHLDEFPNINILNESIDEYRKYAGIYDLNSDTISFLPKNTIHYNFINEMDVFKGKVRFGVSEYKNSVIGYICSDTREHVMKVLKKLKKKFSSLPIEYWMIEYFENGKRIRMNIDNSGRTIYENKNDWFPSWENIKNKILKESFNEKYDDVREELNYIKQRYLDGELDVYDATNEVDGIIGDKSNAEAIVDSWDDSSKHGLYGINNEALLNKISNDPNVYIQGRDENDAGQEPDVEKILDSIKYIANTYNKTFNEAKEIYSEISNIDVYSMEELDEDTVYDHSWYEVKGQKYPKRTKEGVICESENDVLNDILRDLDKYIDNNSINTENVCDVIEKNMRKNNISDESFDDLFAEVNDKLVSHDIRMTDEKLNEMCSGGACCAGAVATVPSPAKPKTPKRKHKKSKVDEMALNMFKRQIIEDVNSQINLNGNHYEFKNGYLYINGDIARTKSKYKMLEYLDENIELETLAGFNSEEMKLLEDIEASESIGNEDDNNQNNNSNNNNNANNNNNQQNINQDNLGNVDQNVTQDNDLTPQQRQLKKDTEKTLDQSMKSGSDTEVSVNQGLDNNNDTINNPTPNTNNIKYKVIGKDDSDTNNIKYIIQDPNTKQTMVVDATKLRLEK